LHAPPKPFGPDYTKRTERRMVVALSRETSTLYCTRVGRVVIWNPLHPPLLEDVGVRPGNASDPVLSARAIKAE